MVVHGDFPPRCAIASIGREHNENEPRCWTSSTMTMEEKNCIKHCSVDVYDVCACLLKRNDDTTMTRAPH